MTEEYFKTQRFYKDVAWQANQDKRGKIKLRELIESTFNISQEARRSAKSLVPELAENIGHGLWYITMTSKDGSQRFGVQLGSSGVIHCTCGAMDSGKELNVCGHVLFGLRFASRFWIGVSDCIRNYLLNIGVDK